MTMINNCFKNIEKQRNHDQNTVECKLLSIVIRRSTTQLSSTSYNMLLTVSWSYKYFQSHLDK